MQPTAPLYKFGHTAKNALLCALTARAAVVRYLKNKEKTKNELYMTNEKNDNQYADNQQIDDTNTAEGKTECGQDNTAADANVADQQAEAADNSAGAADSAEEWKDKYMRLSAEFDNYRKRTLKEKLEIINAGGEDVIKSLLPVLDDMDRALSAMQTSEDIEAVRQGIELISHKLRETLKGRGLAEIECVGKELDTDLHEAVAKIPSQNADDKGKIVDVAQKGYSLKEKVIRHAKVVVGE